MTRSSCDHCCWAFEAIAVTAKATFNGHELTDIQVLNLGDWFDRPWLIGLGGSCWPLFLIVDEDNISDALDKLAESEKYGRNIVVPASDLDDFPEDSRHHSATGQRLDLDHLMIHGQEGAKCPFLCWYFGDGLTKVGVPSTEFERVQKNLDDANYHWRTTTYLFSPNRNSSEVFFCDSLTNLFFKFPRLKFDTLQI